MPNFYIWPTLFKEKITNPHDRIQTHDCKDEHLALRQLKPAHLVFVLVINAKWAWLDYLLNTQLC